LTNLNTQIIGKVLHSFAELDSTQDQAHILLSQSRPPEGTIITAAFQRKGKGLMQNTWSSDAGRNLLFSLILYPSFLQVNRAFLLSQAMALAVRDWVGRYARPAQVKWPNDVYIGHKKVAGMLIQNALSGSRIQSSIIGVGLNLNQTEFPEGLPNPGSILGETGVELDPERALSELCWHLEYWYLQLQSGEWSGIHSDYLNQLYAFGELRTFIRRDGTQFLGRIAGVEENGYLLIDQGGRREAFEVKEVQLAMEEDAVNERT
jgi:BirA family biotin operon repressor/biotin-[acetyl-CoA-carboxylase] ligase